MREGGLAPPEARCALEAHEQIVGTYPPFRGRIQIISILQSDQDCPEGRCTYTHRT